MKIEKTISSHIHLDICITRFIWISCLALGLSATLFITSAAAGSPDSLSISVTLPRDTISAGDSLYSINARIYDDSGIGRPEYDSLIQWSLLPAGTTSSIRVAKGSGNTFYGRKAYMEYYIIAKFGDPLNPIRTLIDTFKVYVKPGPDYRVWIEADGNINPTSNAPAILSRLRNPAHVPLVTMTSSEIYQTVAAVVRDAFGNFTRLAFNSQWSEVPKTTSMVITVNGPSPNQFVGIINRTTNDSGTTKVRVGAKDLATNFDLVPDTTLVKLLLGYITKIKFVNAVTQQDITSININTDQEITVMVLGVLSTDPDTNHFVDITCLWSLTNNVFASEFPLPTTSEGQWRFSPTRPGGPSNLTVTTGSGTTQRSATIPVTVTVAPPSYSAAAFFKIITPPDSLFAGVPFHAVVSIYNKDGLVPGVYCYPGAVYQDSLGKGTTPDPTVITDTSGIINQTPGTANTVKQCFFNGIDTISITLYRAPYHNITDPKDTLHQLVVLLDNLSATTGPFKLLPGHLYKLNIENVNGVHLTGTDTLKWPSGAITMYSMGYDLFGNRRGREASNWYVTGNLHQPGQTIGISQLYYDASQATGNESGLMIARALRSSAINDSTGDTLGFQIGGPGVALDSAVTRDMNGNGYLDKIEIYFNRRYTFPPGFSLTDFMIIYTRTIDSHAVTITFPVDTMEPMDSTGTKYLLHLLEDSTSIPGSPQTAWRPYFSMRSSAGSPFVPAYQCRDGTGPVIWKVVKTISTVSDRRQDTVRVTFSEPVQGKNGAVFQPSAVKPSDVFNVYRRRTGGGFDTLETFLDSIASFSGFVNDSTLAFSMSNSKDLTMNDYLNINSGADKIYDSRQRTGGGVGVAPVIDNRKVQTVVQANPRVLKAADDTRPFVRTIQTNSGFFIFYGGYSQNQVLARIYTLKGQLINVISPPRNSNNILPWKYIDRNGNRVTKGVYILSLHAGNQVIRQKIPVTR